MRRSLQVLAVLVLLVLLPTPRFAQQVGGPFEPPSPQFLFGTDDLGRDVFWGVLEGARVSLFVGLSTALLAFGLGTLVGIGAGLLGGAWDDAMMRFVELFQIVPRFFLALVVLTIWGYDVWLLVLVLGLTSWSGLARLARAETISIRERDFVQAAEASGAPFARVFIDHVLPQAVRPLIAAAPLTMSSAMLTEAGLSFLGIGSLERVSWGYLMQNAQPFLRDAWWMGVFPGLAMTATVTVIAFTAFRAQAKEAS